MRSKKARGGKYFVVLMVDGSQWMYLSRERDSSPQQKRKGARLPHA